FTNEARNYNDMTKPFFDQDASRHEPRNVPAFLIVDAQYMERYVLVTAVKGRPTPDYVTEAASLRELAARIGIDASGLQAEVERWNTYCETGVDPDFERGSSAFDRFYGDPEAPVHPNFGT